MLKSQYLNLRFSDPLFIALQRRAALRGVTIAAYVRRVIDTDPSVEGQPLIFDLSPNILTAAVCVHRLFAALNEAEELPELVRETRRLASRMGIGNV